MHTMYLEQCPAWQVLFRMSKVRLLLCLLCAQGLPARSIQWGAWQGGGMATANAGIAARLRQAGMQLISPQLGLACLGETDPWMASKGLS